MSKPTRRRVYLFITRTLNGVGQILVFTHHDTKIMGGVQTPGGTIEPHETPHKAALREAFEETGLTLLGEPQLLFEDTYENDDEILGRSFFQIPVTGETEDAWIHRVLGEGIDLGIEFHLRWVDLPHAGDLDPHFNAYLNLVVV